MTLRNSLGGDFYRCWRPLDTNESWGCNWGTYHFWSSDSACISVCRVGKRVFAAFKKYYVIIGEKDMNMLLYNNLLRKMKSIWAVWKSVDGGKSCIFAGRKVWQAWRKCPCRRLWPPSLLPAAGTEGGRLGRPGSLGGPHKILVPTAVVVMLEGTSQPSV